MSIFKKSLFLLSLFLLTGLFLILFFLWIGGGNLSTLPQDLGVGYTEADQEIAKEKLGIKTVKISSLESVSKSITYEGKHSIDTSLTQEELTALANSSNWKYYPLSQVQIKINPDQSLEIAGLLLSEKLGDYLEAISEKNDLLIKVIKLTSYRQKNLPFYLKVFLTIQNNEPNCQIQKIQLGSLPLLPFLVGNPNKINNLIKKQLLPSPEFSLESLKIEEGQLKLKGTLPNIEYLSED